MNRTTTFTLDEVDLARAARLHTFSSIREARTIIRLSLLWFVATAGFAAFLYASGTPWAELGGSLPGVALAVATTILGVAVGVPLLVGPLAISRRFRQDKLLRQPVSVRWDAEAYEANQPGIHNHIRWRDYMKRREDRHVFVFFLSDYQYQVLPKRALDCEQVEDIQRLLSAI